VLQKMPDSVIEIGIDGEEDGRLYLKMFFCALGPCLKGFHKGCRPYLSVDSTSLNGKWNEHLPSATGVDRHKWMFPIAFGFFEGELKYSWTWFLLQLWKAIGHPSSLAIHCDASKGLIGAVKDVFSQAEMRECFQHLMQNYIKQFPGKEHMYSAKWAYRREVHE
jgi:transposase-like protein